MNRTGFILNLHCLLILEKAVRFACLLAFISWGSFQLTAAAEEIAISSTSDQDAAALELLKTIDNLTEIATKTKQNADYVPGTISVLYHADLKAMGIQNVWEAIALIPGVDRAMESMGALFPITRGLDRSVLAGNVKMLVDGIEMNQYWNGYADGVWRIPIDMVDRIEVIRGPGSVIYGDFAGAAVVNVIKKTNANELYGHFGTRIAGEGGANLKWDDLKKDLHLVLNVYKSVKQAGDFDTGADLLTESGAFDDRFQSPERINDSEDIGIAIFGIQYKDLKLSAGYSEGGVGSYWGMFNIVPTFVEQHALKQTDFHIDAQQHIDLTSDMQADINLGWRRFTQHTNYSYLLSDLYTADGYYEESKYNGSLDLKYSGWQSHSLFFEYSYSTTTIDDAWFDTNTFPLTGPFMFIRPPLPTVERFYGENAPIETGINRRINSLAIQDQYLLTLKTTLTGGLRYSHISDVGESWTYRLSGVHRITNQHIVKAQYARGFASPSFMAMYSNWLFLKGNPDLKIMTNDTYEIGYIYNSDATNFRSTLFHSIVDNDIYTDYPHATYANTGKGQSTGIELELGHRFNLYYTIQGNISYAQTEDSRTGEEFPRSTNWLANLSFIYKPIDRFNVAVNYHYTGDRHRAVNDSRSDLNGYQTVDFTLNYGDLILKGLDIGLGIKNLFDEDVRYPAPAYFEKEYQQTGRQWWINLCYSL